ncbi:S-phase delaying protein 1 [Sphaceloma murrayae]|uniref:S-phase delaying protein 1 n=1 Tax=Sphaceloma murrayae TaxID=2082308 RepID=A0A2K1R2V3_9PEZI|nr:S-phase delaying protein 1 [Sphaceloma murrayae]
MSHTRKKPFTPSGNQSSIRTYFTQSTATASPSSSSSSSSSAPQPRTPLSPPVPDQIQSSLLNVGMRVRKSVPEGYKTHKTLGSGPGMRPSSSAPVQMQTGRGGGEWEEDMQTGPVRSSAPLPPPPRLLRSVSDRSRELMPFCGLHSVGGMGREGPEVPDLTYSQGSGVSGLGMGWEGQEGLGGSRKRGLELDYEDEVEREMDEFFDGEMGDLEAESGGRMAVGRKIATMRGRRIDHGSGLVGVRVVDDFDDGDVGFLQPMEVDA